MRSVPASARGATASEVTTHSHPTPHRAANLKFGGRPPITQPEDWLKKKKRKSVSQPPNMRSRQPSCLPRVWGKNRDIFSRQKPCWSFPICHFERIASLVLKVPLLHSMGGKGVVFWGACEVFVGLPTHTFNSSLARGGYRWDDLKRWWAKHLP